MILWRIVPCGLAAYACRNRASPSLCMATVEMDVSQACGLTGALCLLLMTLSICSGMYLVCGLAAILQAGPRFTYHSSLCMRREFLQRVEAAYQTSQQQIVARDAQLVSAVSAAADTLSQMVHEVGIWKCLCTLSVPTANLCFVLQVMSLDPPGSPALRERWLARRLVEYSCACAHSTRATLSAHIPHHTQDSNPSA